MTAGSGLGHPHANNEAFLLWLTQTGTALLASLLPAQALH